MTKGIHGNRDCIRCGACCVYFPIPNGEEDLDRDPGLDPIFKNSGIPCQHLAYDLDKKQATCQIHEGKRPPACSDWFCDDINNQQVREGLKRYANGMEDIIKAREIAEGLMKLLSTQSSNNI